MVDFISTPVMGGFISGIALTIILMQIPKILGSGALILIRLAKKFAPRFPMAIVMMVVGVGAAALFHVNEYGVVLLSAVEPGMPGLFIPDIGSVDLTHAAGRGLMVAVVIMAETLLSEKHRQFLWQPG